jgi:hypothetical protein
VRPTWKFGWETPREAVLSRGQQYATYKTPAAPSDEYFQCLQDLGMDLRRIRRPVKAEEKKPRFGGAFFICRKQPEPRYVAINVCPASALIIPFLTDIRIEVS